MAASSAADLTVRYTQSADRALIVSYFDTRVDGDGLLGTLQIENISRTWVYVEQDVTVRAGAIPVLLPYTVYLLGPGMTKTVPSIRFSSGSYLKLTATTPVGLDFASA